MNIRTFAIVVTYYPDLARLVDLCKLLGRHADVIVVDNTPEPDSPAPVPGTLWLPMGENLGIAAAQNAGIRAALNRGAEAIAFFDQDSMPDERLLPILIPALGSPPRGVVAPVCVDTRTGSKYPSFRFNRLGWARPVSVERESGSADVDLVNSSGSVAAAAVFDVVGLMDEDFFIDYVDLEWCIRCRSAGIPITVVGAATMPHTIGNAVTKTCSLTTFIHSPVRAYYRLRNPFLLLRKRHVPPLYSLHEIAAATVHHLLQLPHTSDRRQHVRLGWRALVDGLKGARGRIGKS